MTSPEMTTETTNHSTGLLLLCGAAAGPLFLVVWLIQALTREGFDLTRHPLSLLALGGAGWVQILNFAVCGCCYLTFAVGIRRALATGRGAFWAPALIGISGTGLIVAGVFTTDPGAGFPPGAPEGAPEHVTWHGVLHEVGFALSALWIVAAFVLARRFAAAGRKDWMAICIAAPLLMLVIDAVPVGSLSVRLVIGSAIQFGYYAALALHLRGQLAGSRG